MVNGYLSIIFFRFLNLGIIISVMVYVVKTYLIGRLREKIDDYKAARDQQHQRHQENTERYAHIKKVCAQEAERYTHAKQQIIHWQERVHAQEAEQQQLKTVYQERIARKQAIVQRYRDYHSLYKQIGATVINDLEHELKSSCAPDEVGGAYIKKIMNSLNQAGDA